MAKKRSNSEGSVFKKPNGKWRAQVSLDGKRLSFTAATKRECLDWIRNTQHQIDKGLTIKGTEISLKKFLVEWLKTIKASKAQSTYNLYHWYVHSRIIPHLGRILISDLRADRIQRYYEHMLSIEGKSEHQVSILHKVLRLALNHAVKMGYIARNPALDTTPPKPKQKEMSFYDENQVQVFLDTALEMEDRFYPLYYLAIHTGMRQAELMGLKWSDLDWKQKTISITRQVQHFKGSGYKFNKPKSKSGNRIIILGDQALEVLKEQRETIEELKANVNRDWTELDLIFPSNVGTPLMASNIRRGFQRLIEESELPKIRFHDLRHTAASLMLNHGIPVLIASRRLGHSKPSITMDVYGHMIPSKQAEAATLLDQLMKQN